MYKPYRLFTQSVEPVWEWLLNKRLRQGKEHPQRVLEKKGITEKPRPKGALIWFHAASVGEAQSTLILIRKITEIYPKANILVTSGTLTSSQMMEKNLPKNAFHQFYPLDHPVWVKRFLEHWSPDLIFWMESELWPNMLYEIEQHSIPAILVNARLSDKSYRTWKLFPNFARDMLGTYTKILCQTPEDEQKFKTLGAIDCTTTDNLKYSSTPIPHDPNALKELMQSTSGRPMWLYASTHKGEEDLACTLHSTLKQIVPDLLTIVVPRHPERRDEIKEICEAHSLKIMFRSEEHKSPKSDTDIYIADTLGELGLFYRLTPIACIGRSFSDDGGGGHNPIEAAQLGCAILHGPHVQNLQDIFDEMDSAGAAIHLSTTEHFRETLLELLNDPQKTQELQRKALNLSKQKNTVIDIVMKAIMPIVDEALAIKAISGNVEKNDAKQNS